MGLVKKNTSTIKSDQANYLGSDGINDFFLINLFRAMDFP